MESDKLDTQERIRQLMVQRGWTEYRLSKEAKLSQSTISNVFRRNNEPTLPTLKAICHAFGITLAQFFSDGSNQIELNEEQRQLFEKWNTLSQEQKKLLLALMNTM